MNESNFFSFLKESLHQGPGQMDIKGGENPNLLHFDDGCNNVKE